MKSAQNSVRLAPARKGYSLSVLDACVLALRPQIGQRLWPVHSLHEIEIKVSKIRGGKVANATLRSVIYKHGDLFERIGEGPESKWRLSNKAKHLSC